MRLDNMFGRRQSRAPQAWMAGSCLGAGAAAMYFLDPVLGKSRRAYARDRMAGTMRRCMRALGRSTRGATADTYGLAQQAQHLRPEHWSVPNDATLANRVESELFRDPDIPKGRINVNAEAGMIVLRGELDRPDQIRAIEDRVNRMPGVRGVHSLLHLRGTPAPHLESVVPAP